MKPEAVLFDLGDTIIETQAYRLEAGVRALLSAASHRNGAAVEDVVNLARELNVEFGKRANDSSLEYSQQAFHRMLYGSLGVFFDMPEEEVERLYWDNALEFAPEPGVADALEAVRATGLTMGVISNASFSGKVLEHELAKHGLLDYFDFLVSTADYGLRKPHPQIFRVGIQKAAVAPEHAWYVGNSLQYDVDGALGVGLTPVWYNRVGQEGEVPQKALTISLWDEFPPMVQAALEK